MLAREEEWGRLWDLVGVVADLHEHAGIMLTDDEVEAVKTLADLSAAVARHTAPAPDREARAGALVTEAARRVAPRLVGDGG